MEGRIDALLQKANSLFMDGTAKCFSSSEPFMMAEKTRPDVKTLLHNLEMTIHKKLFNFIQTPKDNFSFIFLLTLHALYYQLAMVWCDWWWWWWCTLAISGSQHRHQVQKHLLVPNCWWIMIGSFSNLNFRPQPGTLIRITTKYETQNLFFFSNDCILLHFFLSWLCLKHTFFLFHHHNPHQHCLHHTVSLTGDPIRCWCTSSNRRQLTSL